MRNSALLQIFTALDKKGRRDLRKWLHSPLFNQREDVVLLFDFLDRNLDQYPAQVQKPLAWQAVYPAKAYDDTRMNLLMSWLLRQLRDFLAWREWRSEETAAGLHLCRALRRAGLDVPFERAWADAHEALETAPFRDEQYHFQQYLLYREKYEQEARVRRTPEVPPVEMSRHFDAAVRLNHLRFECTNAGSSIAGRPAARGAEHLGQHPGIRIYEPLLRALQHPADEASFYQAKDLLLTQGMAFRDSERRDLYLLALNFCIRKINTGQRAFMWEAFILYREGLENRTLFENGFLSRFTYKNAVTAGLWLGEFEWVQQFLDDYKPFLHPRERHQAYLYNLAVYYFRLPDYDRAMDLLRDADFGDDVPTNLDARSMLLRIYYERGYLDALESFLDSFQAYLRRNRSTSFQPDNYTNLLRIVRQILRASPITPDLRRTLREEVETSTALAERAWLLEQLG